MPLVCRERRIDITSQSPAITTPFRSTPGGAFYAPPAESFATTKRHAQKKNDRNDVKVDVLTG